MLITVFRNINKTKQNKTSQMLHNSVNHFVPAFNCVLRNESTDLSSVSNGCVLMFALTQLTVSDGRVYVPCVGTERDGPAERSAAREIFSIVHHHE